MLMIINITPLHNGDSSNNRYIALYFMVVYFTMMCTLGTCHCTGMLPTATDNGIEKRKVQYFVNVFEVLVNNTTKWRMIKWMLLVRCWHAVDEMVNRGEKNHC